MSDSSAQDPGRRPSRLILQNAIVALAYLAGGVLSVVGGLITTGPNGQSSTVWLPPGIALAAMLVKGKRIWPGILVGGVFLDVMMALHEAPTAPASTVILIAAVITVATVLQTLATCSLIQRFAGRSPTLDHARAVLRFLLCSFAGSVIVTTLGSLCLVAVSVRKLANLPHDLGSWWVSDTVSVFLITPVILSWIGVPARVWRPRRAQLTIPLSIALVLMAVAFVQANHLENDRAQRQFELRTSHLQTTLAHELAGFTEEINSLRDLEEVAPSTDSARFRSFAARQRARDVTIASIGWIAVVPAGERAAYEKSMHQAGELTYAIRDERGETAQAPVGDAYFPVQFAEPRETGTRVLGFDYGSNPDRRAVLDASAGTGMVSWSSPLDLLFRVPSSRGVLAAVTVREQAVLSGNRIRGFVVGVLRVEPLMRELMSPVDARELSVSIEDVGALAGKRLLFASTNPVVLRGRLPYSSSGDVAVGGRHWRLHVEPTPSYIDANRSWLSAAVSVAGLAFSTLLCGFLLVTTGSAANIRQQVQERTIELSRANGQLRDEIAIHEGMERTLMENEQELAAHRERLEDLVRARTAELEVAKSAAEDASRAKSAFLANMSHELRTPMHAILAYAKLAMERGLDQKLKGFVDRIMVSGERLLSLLNDLLDLSKLEAGKMRAQLARHDVAAIVQEIADEIEPLLEKKKLSLVIEPRPAGQDAVADVDRAQMGQVFRNILANAVRFSSEGGRLTVSFAGAELPGPHDGGGVAGRSAIEVAFADQGLGIPADELDAIFDKFVQSSKTRTSAGGTGLGLAICKQITELHGGRINARNNNNGGATFVVTIPRQMDRAASGKSGVAA